MTQSEEESDATKVPGCIGIGDVEFHGWRLNL